MITPQETMRAMKYCAALTIAMGITVPAAAQPAGNYRVVQHITIQPGRAGEWQAATKERNAVWKKAGLTRGLNVWASITGPIEYRTVAYYEKLGDLDVTPGGDPRTKDVRGELAAIVARLQSCSTITSRVVDEVQPDLSLPRSQSAPQMIVVARTLIRSERVDDYLALVKNELMPAVKASGMKAYVVARTRFGGPTSEFHVSSSINGWTDFDGESPLIKAMGQDKYRSFVAKVSPMQTSRTVNVYRYMPDLSYTPAAAGSAR